MHIAYPKVIFNFSESTGIENWIIVDDGVMGGVSAGKFSLNKEKNGVFEGNISLENNGGFSSVRHGFEPLQVNAESKIVLTLKGDGKDYQFRIKDKANSYYSYITTFSTSGEWQKIEILLSDLYPSFRGQKLQMPNFHKDTLEEITFLIANKKKESFKLVLDKIELY
ncbi:CIA30 family protein [Flavobacterium sp.]|uniref:CIA30 family protein n=1 Tax=Flavobacterium sp. TaxID=239 RepID=UPI0026083393|nr:CIA30 family protein [Flavobacterium sp.]MDD2985571.1 CIA30 family protein [Flavobacterium sp.]